MVELLFAICLFVEELAFYFYNSILFSISAKRVKVVIVYIMAYMFVFFCHSFESVYSIVFNIIVFLISNILVLVFLYKLRFISALIHALLISGLSIFSEVIIGEAFQRFARNIWGDISNINNLILLSPSVMVFFLLAIISAVVERKIADKDFPRFEIAMVIVLSGVAFIATVCTYFGIIGTIDIAKKDALLSANIFVFVFLLIGFIFAYYYMRKKEIISSRQKMLLNTEKDRMIFINEINERDFQQRILIHDIKKHFVAMQIMVQNNDISGLEEYLHLLTESSALAPPIRYCSYDYLNSILYKYQKMAENNKTQFTVDSNSVDLSFVDKYDMTVIMCNFLENSIEATRDLDNSFIAITLTHDVEKNISIIRIVNSCGEKVKFSQGLPVSSKPETHKHGLGIRSARKAIEKYSGDINIYQDDNLDFHVIVLLCEGNQ